MQIDCSEEQPENACTPRVETWQSLANAKLERFAQPAKQPAKINSIDEGMHIDSSDEQYENACTPSVETLQSLANLKIERSAQQ
jgi:hypothetical protein